MIAPDRRALVQYAMLLYDLYFSINLQRLVVIDYYFCVLVFNISIQQSNMNNNYILFLFQYKFVRENERSV